MPATLETPLQERLAAARETLSHQLIAAKKEGIKSSAPLGLLILACAGDGVGPTAAAKTLGVSGTVITAHIDVLEGRHLIERRRCQSDRRKFLIHPTEQGRSALDRILAA